MRLSITADDPKFLKSLVHIFEANYYVVDGVSDGALAFDYASSGEYDGLVLDIMMPGTDGVTLLKKLRKNGITTISYDHTNQGKCVILVSHSPEVAAMCDERYELTKIPSKDKQK